MAGGKGCSQGADDDASSLYWSQKFAEDSELRHLPLSTEGDNRNRSARRSTLDHIQGIGRNNGQ